MRFPKRIRIGPELRKRLIYTILLAGLFRGLTLVPVFDVQQGELDQILAENPLLGAIDLFAGGEVIVNFSIVGAGIFPVILATLIVNGATWFVPRLRELRELGEAGRKRLKIYSRLLTIIIAFLIAWIITELLSAEIGLLPGKIRWLTWASLLPSLKIILLFTLGSTLATAISDLITNKGVYEGEGVLLIVGVFFSFCSRAVEWVRQWPPPIDSQVGIQAAAGFVAITICLFLVKFIWRVPVQQARQIASSRRPSSSNYLPFRLVYGGVVPVSAAIGSLALARITQEFVEVYILGKGVAGSTALGGWTAPQNGWSWLVFALLITAFTYLSNFALIWGGSAGEGPSLADELKYRGTFIPGVRPGRRTARYLSKLMLKISAIGSLILCVLAVALPWLVFYLTGQDLTVTFLSLFVVIEHLDRFWDHLKADYLQESYSSLL